MSDQQQGGAAPAPEQAAPPPVPGGTPPAPMLPAPSRMEVEAGLLRAINTCSVKAAGADDAREIQEYAASALNFSQALVILDPNVIAPQGVPPHILAASMPQPPEPTPSAQGESGGGQ
jgi:hypothetical protein